MDAAGITASARILDAGCGTGRHAAELARLPHAPAYQADLCTLDLGTRYDAITCRGVLNDLLHDQDREAVIAAFARHLHETGLRCW